MTKSAPNNHKDTVESFVMDNEERKLEKFNTHRVHLMQEMYRKTVSKLLKNFK